MKNKYFEDCDRYILVKNDTLKLGPISRNCDGSRSGGREPTGRRLRERAAAARLRPPPHRRAGHDGSAALRHLAAAPRLPRLRLQDTHQVLRDRLGEARLDRRHQAKGTDSTEQGQKLPMMLLSCMLFKRKTV